MAAILNACMDTIAHHRSVSVFMRLPPRIRYYMLRDWRARYEGNDPRRPFRTYRILGIPIRANWLDSIHDGWHLCKTLMIASICLAVVSYRPITPWWWADFLVLGGCWNVSFVIFYDKILR